MKLIDKLYCCLFVVLCVLFVYGFGLMGIPTAVLMTIMFYFPVITVRSFQFGRKIVRDAHEKNKAKNQVK